MPKFNPKISILTKLFFGFWFLYFLFFWSKAIFIDETGNLFAGHVNIWGDWAAHFTMATAMENRGFFLTSSPFLIGAKFSYPFMADQLSAIFYHFSGDLIYSFLVPSFLLSIFFVWVIYYFFLNLWKSERKAILSSLIFLLNGGLGFYYYFKDNLANKSFFELVINPLHEVTRFDQYQIKWISIVDSMMIPQRAFLLGFPLTVLALTFIYQYFFTKNNHQKWRVFASALILGTMPIIHTHSFLAAFIILSFWSLEDLLNNKSKLKERLPSWLTLAGLTGIISFPLISYYFFSQVDHGFSQFFPGWLAKDYEMNWLDFWFRNWLFVPWLSFLGFFLIAKKNLKHILVFSPFIFIFIVANLFLFQPFAWDNTKLFVWSSLGFSYLVIYVFQAIWQKRADLKYLKPIKFLIIGSVFLTTILSGAMDLHYIIRHDLHSHVMYSKEELELVEWIRSNTSKNSIWLTGDKHNHPVFNLTGRQTVLTYRGWLWTHGYDYKEVEQDVTDFYKNPQDHLGFLQKYNIDYLVIGDNERAVWKANEKEFIQTFKLIRQTRTYKIFENQYN